MQEIKLWEVTTGETGEPSVQPVKGIDQTKTEEQLEEIIVHRPDLLFKDLKLVGRQTAAAGGALDLLGVDAEGRLIVFELKRGTLTREAVSQIIDYASYLAEMDSEDLSRHISERSGDLGIEKIDDFLAWYQEQFAKSVPMSQRPRMVLIGLGADDRARRMVSFLADSDIDMSLITFHAFQENGRILLARQVEVEAKPPPDTGDTKAERARKLKRKVEALGIEGYYYKLAEFFRDQLSAYEWPNPGGYSYYLTELTETGSQTNRVYVSLYVYDNSPGKVEVRIQPRAVEAASNVFDVFKQNLGGRVKQRSDGGAEIWIGSWQDWEAISENFQKLCPAIVEGWKRIRDLGASAELQESNREANGGEPISKTVGSGLHS